MMSRHGEEGSELRQGTKVRGRICGEGDLHVFGRVEGVIELGGTLYVEASGEVEAEVMAARVIVTGLLVGQVCANELVRIAPQGSVRGEIVAPALTLDEGGRFVGSLRNAPSPEMEEALTELRVQTEDPGSEEAREGLRRRKRLVLKKRG